MNIVALKNHSYIHTYKYKVVGKEVGICINIIASKGVIVVPKYYPTSGYQNLLLCKFNSQFHTIIILLLPFMDQKPHHKENQQG